MFGEISSINFFTNKIILYKNYTLGEKQQWLHDLVEKINIKKETIDLNNIPWDSINNQNELLTYILTLLINEKKKFITQVNTNNVYENLNAIFTFIANHPYICLAAVTSSAVVTYLYYDAITNYLLKLGSMFKNFIKTSSQHAEVTEKLLENEQIIKNQLSFILEELPKIDSRDEQYKYILHIHQYLTKIGISVRDLSEIIGRTDSKVIQLRARYKKQLKYYKNMVKTLSHYFRFSYTKSLF